MSFFARACPRSVLVLALCLPLLAASGCATIGGWFGGDDPEPEAASEGAVAATEPAPEARPASTPAAPKPASPKPVDVTEGMPKAPKAPTPAKAVAKPDASGDVRYADVEELKAAWQEAKAADRYVGDIADFDAFPSLPGNDTRGRAFKADDAKKVEVRFFAFALTSGKPFNNYVYGYIVDAGGGKVFGHFDTDADGVFDAHTLEPKIRFDLFEQVKPIEAL